MLTGGLEQKFDFQIIKNSNLIISLFFHIINMEKFTQKSNRNFWNEYAKKNKDDSKGAHSDKHLVELEDRFIESILKTKKPSTLLDIGCGNGQRTIRFSRFVKDKTVGVDYSENMIKECNLSLLKQKKNIQKKFLFNRLDAKMINKLNSFDVIISCRCLVNQNSSKKQVELFKLIHSKLKKNGSLIIAEGSEEGLQKLNSLRKIFGLKKINVPWHNLPISEKYVLPKISKLFKIKQISRLGTFFFLSRVIHPAIVYPNNPNANTIINQISLKAEILLDKKNANFTELLENYGSHLLIHFIKK